MFNQDQNAMQGSAYSASTSVDAGLRAYMLSIYNFVAGGLAVSGLVAYAVSVTPALQAFFFNPAVTTITGIGLLVFLWFGFNPNKFATQSVASVQAKYFFFCAILGTTLSYIFLAYSGASLTRVFFITAATFAGMGLWGYTTKSNLMAFGSFLTMGLIGIIIASLVNLFLHSSGLQFIVSMLSVLVFTGLIAYQTQASRRYYSGNADMDKKMAIYSAFGLYINFINLFQTLLNLMGNRN